MRNLKLGIYEHYKGKKYQVLFLAKDRDTLEDLVVYEALYNNRVSKLWVGTLKAFLGKVEVNGKKVPRFTPLENINPAYIGLKKKDSNK